MRAILLAMLVLPLAGALIQAFFAGAMGRRLSGLLACLAVAGAFAMAVAAFAAGGGQTHAVALCAWFSWESFQAQASLLYDPLAAVVALSVTGVASLIHVYATGYMREDKAYGRFFCYMNLFVFFMLIITLADDLLFLFVGWEGVGFCSYALISFWHQKTANVRAGNKAFILTRIGDLGLVAALAILVALLGRASVSGVAAEAGSFGVGMATLLGFLVLFAAMGKSAQLPLTVWLPDAMAGPTPVSALIHAATMVTAGVYLLMRLFPLLSQAPLVLEAVAVAGAVTAFYGALAALGQRDIKRILAYSTVSQVGYMFLAVGAGDVAGSMFHLVTHAGFKALLFMGAGILIQAVHEEQDIFRMGARLKNQLPATYVLFLAGSISLAGLPLTAGFCSKGRVLEAALAHGDPVFLACAVLGAAAALLTALYVFRMVYVVFWNSPADPAPLHHDPAIARMARPLWPLGAWALFMGLVNAPAFLGLPGLLDGVLEHVPGGHLAQHPSQALELAVAVGDSAVALAGMWLAWQFYGPGRAVASHPGLLTAGLGLDDLYRGFVAGPYQWLAGIFWRDVDHGVLDRGVAWGAGGFMVLSENLRRLATGRISTTLAMLMAAMAAALAYVAAWPL